MLSLPSSPLRPDPPVSPAPTDFTAPRRLYRGPSLSGSARGDRRDLPCFGCPSLFDCRPVPRRETARLPPPSSFGERIGHRAFYRRLASPFPQPALSALTGSWWVSPNGAISSPWVTALEVARPPLSDRPRCPSASGRRDLYTRACPRVGRPSQGLGMTTAPYWVIAPAGPSPARTDSGTGCT